MHVGRPFCINSPKFKADCNSEKFRQNSKVVVLAMPMDSIFKANLGHQIILKINQASVKFFVFYFKCSFADKITWFLKNTNMKNKLQIQNWENRS